MCKCYTVQNMYTKITYSMSLPFSSPRNKIITTCIHSLLEVNSFPLQFACYKMFFLVSCQVTGISSLTHIKTIFIQENINIQGLDKKGLSDIFHMLDPTHIYNFLQDQWLGSNTVLSN